MQHKTLNLLVGTLAGLLLVGCSPADHDSVQTAEQEAYLDQLYADYFAADLELDPLQATFLGQHQYDDQLANTLSAEYREQRAALEEEFLLMVQEIDPEPLSETARLSHAVFKRDRQMTLAGMEFPAHLLPINQFYNMANRLAMLGAGESAQPFKTVTDYDNWASRMAQIPALLEQAQANMQEGVAEGITQPRILMERALTQIADHLPDDWQDSAFMQPVQEFPEDIPAAEQERLYALYAERVAETVLPAYQQLHDYIANDYLAQARTDSYGLGQLPGGEDWYQYKVAWRTTTDLTPADIHELGVTEVARIHDEIRDIMAEVGFSGSLEEFFEFTRDDEQFHYESREAMLTAYQEYAERAEAAAAQLFWPDMLPEAGYEVRKVERFREQSASSGSYSAPPEDGSRPGIFYLNTYDLPARPTWAKAALTLHEAVPGHHYQLALQREMTDLPPFRRFGGETAFIEGWGLYAESLGEELGVYGAYDQYGALVAELWRAIRLVVDTGIHAQGWSREQVLEYMYENAPVAEARAVSEAERYMALPGQALAYKIGQLEIQRLRERAETLLGDDFEVRDFHREILRHGSLPLELLEQQIEQWLAQERVGSV